MTTGPNHRRAVKSVSDPKETEVKLESLTSAKDDCSGHEQAREGFRYAAWERVKSTYEGHCNDGKGKYDEQNDGRSLAQRHEILLLFR